MCFFDTILLQRFEVKNAFKSIFFYFYFLRVFIVVQNLDQRTASTPNFPLKKLFTKKYSE